MGHWTLVLLGTLVLVSGSLANVFFITAPDVFHYGRDETVSVNILNSQAAISVDVYLQDYPGKQRTFSRKTVQVQPNTPVLTEMKVTPEDLPEVEDDDVTQYVYLVADAAAAGFRKETVVLLSANSHYVFIQTDKPLYTPRQTVYGRIYTMDHSMKPDNIPIQLDIMNPQGVVIDRQTELSSDDGIINTHFTFPAIVMTGNWSFVASYGHQNKRNVTAKFEVKEYVLPTFSVKVNAPKFILPSDERINGFIESTHTYGEAVQGRAMVKFEVLKGDVRRHFLTATATLDMNGVYSFTVDLAELHVLGQEYQFPQLEGAILHVEATVTETYTGKSQTTISRSTVFASSPYVIKFPRSSKYFKPGLPYVVRMDTKFANGKRAGDLVVQVRATAKSATGQDLEVSGHDNDVNEVTTDPEQGIAQFTLDIPRDAQTLTVTVVTAHPDLQDAQQGRAELSISSYSSPSNSYLLVRVTQQTIRVGDNMEAEVFITNIRDVNSLNYMVIGRGKILYQRTQQRQAGIVSTLHIPVTPEMSPSVRLLVYYVKGNEEVVADSVWVDVVDQCQNPVALIPSKTTYKPGEDAEVELRGDPGSKVALLAVNQAVYVLNDKNALTPDIMFERMEDFDLGCTPGGGQNNQGVFQDVGLTSINNAGMSVPQRGQENCVTQDNRKRRSVDSSVQSDLQTCCQQGRSPLHPATMTVRSCRQRAAAKRDATTECINTFFQCCKEAVVSREDPEQEDPNRGRVDGGGEMLDFLFDLIDENEDEVPVRSRFPESWLFLTKEIGENGRTSQRVTFPDSITSWSLQAVGVSATAGMCVATPSNVTVFKEYFLHLDMPYSVVNGEQVEIKATLYNYRDETIAAFVYLQGSEGICYGARPGENTERIRITVEANKAKTVAWPIVPLETGVFPIRVKAFTSAGGDIVEKKLHVVPEGIRKVQSRTVVLDPSGELHLRRGGPPVEGVQDGKQFSIIPLTLPAETVPGSAHCSISITGEVMGPVTSAMLDGNTFQNLIRAPTGCGEQTLIKLGPMVYVAKYLKETGQMTGEKEKQIYDLIRQGVQHEMQYRKPGGGFAVWTSNRYPPSTWLTAFATKIFSQAREFNALGNDPSDVICKAVGWMGQQQKPSGAYQDPYRVHHREMTGGVGGDITFTAYVLIGMLESGCQREGIQSSVDRAQTFLEGQIDDVTRPYQAAILAYALSLANSNRKSAANTKLREMAVDVAATNHRYWPADTQSFGNAQKPYWYQRKPSVIEIETAAYAVLAQIKNDDITYANPVVNWLMTQRNEKGAFISTQDTVVGLQALSEYSIHIRHAELAMECAITAEADGDFRREIDVNENNADVKQEVEVSNFLGGNLFIDAEGEGVGQVQIEMVYNVHNVGGEQCRFELKVKTEPFVPDAGAGDGDGGAADDNADPFDEFDGVDWDNIEWGEQGAVDLVDRNPFGAARAAGRGRAGGGRSRMGRNRNGPAAGRGRVGARAGASSLVIRINTCVKYLGANDTGMAILDVGLFSGFEPVEEDLKQLEENEALGIGRYELNDRSVVFYLDTVPKDNPVCLTFTAKRKFVVGMTHAVGISVYDYYEPSEKCTKFYHPEFQSPLLQKICAGDQCICAEAKCGKCYSFEAFDEQPWGYQELYLKSCQRGMDYAMKVTVDKIEFDIAFEIITARVEKVIKRGAENVQSQQMVTFWKKASCVCPLLQEGISYYIMGRDGLPYENEAGEKKYKYMLDEGSYAVEYMNKNLQQPGTAMWIQARDQHKWQRDLSKRGCAF